jgi:ParB-like nuclease family protein
MNVRDRIKELRRVRARDLVPNPKNWRTHPRGQRDALHDLLAELGYCDALLVRECPDGSLIIIDGHLRAETTPDAELPVLILDLDEAEADQLLLTLDPLAGLAEPDTGRLNALLDEVSTPAAVREILADLAQPALVIPETPAESVADDVWPESFQILVLCESESQQADLLERLTREGYSCRSLIS